MIYIEDYLQHYVEEIGVTDSNKQILESIHRQCLQGVALTDRQYELVKNKLLEQFDSEKFTVTGNEPTRLPLRKIDRSKYIKIVSHIDVVGPNQVYESYKQDWKWIKVRFPFSKKDIVKIDNINREISTKHIYHKKGTHEHYYKLTGHNLNIVLNYFSNFKISDQVSEYKIKINDILDRREEIINSLPIPITELNNVQKYDRSKRYGFVNLPTPLTDNSLLNNILNRKSNDFNVDNKLYNIDSIITVLNELDRFPLVVLIDKLYAYDELTEFYNAVKYIVPDEKQSVLFRVDNDKDDYNLNNFVKDQNLNNWVDNNTKIVYISKDKLPKIMLKSNFSPITSYSRSNTRNNSIIDLYINYCCDLKLTSDSLNWPNSYQRFIKGRA